MSTISDRSDVVLARSRGHERFRGTSLPQALNRPIYRTGVRKTTNLDGEHVLLAAASAQLTGWRVAVTVPVSLIDSPLRSSLWFWGGVSSAAMILAGLLALALARRLERPLTFTADAARTLGRGELVSGFASGVREAILGHAHRIRARGGSRADAVDYISSLRVRAERYRHVVPARVYETETGEIPAARQWMRAWPWRWTLLHSTPPASCRRLSF